jgi:hypothetical protein
MLAIGSAVTPPDRARVTNGNACASYASPAISGDAPIGAHTAIAAIAAISTSGTIKPDCAITAVAPIATIATGPATDGSAVDDGDHSSIQPSDASLTSVTITPCEAICPIPAIWGKQRTASAVEPVHAIDAVTSTSRNLTRNDAGGIIACDSLSVRSTDKDVRKGEH